MKSCMSTFNMLNSRCCICVVVFLITIMNFIYWALIRQEYKVLFVDLTSSTTAFCSAKGGEINKICLKHLPSKDLRYFVWTQVWILSLCCVDEGLRSVWLLELTRKFVLQLQQDASLWRTAVIKQHVSINFNEKSGWAPECSSAGLSQTSLHK